MAIEIVDAKPRWAADFAALARVIRGNFGPRALRIDHIGSTAVPGLAAKPIIDVQITVSDFRGARRALESSGFAWRSTRADHGPPGYPLPLAELEKRFAYTDGGPVAANVHVRIAGRFNQRYALLCRDYLRAHPRAAAAYGAVKRSLSQIVGDDVEAYYAVKDPVCDILMNAAEDWARASDWLPGESDG